jgi:hypothetical protein
LLILFDDDYDDDSLIYFSSSSSFYYLKIENKYKNQHNIKANQEKIILKTAL